MSAPVTIAYTPAYLDWQLGDTHPTNPERARIAVELIEEWDRARCEWANPDATGVFEAAALVHDQDYLDRVRAGYSAEWSGCQPRLGEVAALMFAGTADLVERLLVDRAAGTRGIYFNPQGAKHHAQRDHSSGFCVLNDMAWAAKRLVAEGLTVLYVDWDAHHGDGVEALLHGYDGAVTASIHDANIYPGTGRDGHDVAAGAYNWGLPAGAGDDALATAMGEVLTLADELAPDVVLLACGADGLAGDPLSTLRFSLAGIADAATALGTWAATNDVPVLVGGAGGYQPLTETPQAWFETVRALALAEPDVSGVVRNVSPVGSATR